MRVATVLSCCIVSMVLAGADPVWAQGRTVEDGVYSAAQAARGKEAYTQACAACHMDSLRGFFDGGAAPPIVGDRFVNGWEAASMLDLFAKLRDTMPKDAAETVDEASKIDILAYLLEMNEFPSGEADLANDVALLTTTMVVPHGGLTPPEPGANVRVVGCLASGANGGWIFTNATEPVRTRGGQPSEGAALEAAAAQPLGTGTIRLMDAFPKPDGHVGHRMEAKGLLVAEIRQRGGGALIDTPGINLSSLTMVSSDCGS